MLWRKLCTALSALTLTACASSRPPSAEIPASLRQPCQPLQPLIDGRAATVLRWAQSTALAYRECADRQAELVRAVHPP